MNRKVLNVSGNTYQLAEYMIRLIMFDQPADLLPGRRAVKISDLHRPPVNKALMMLTRILILLNDMT